jgi:hypothetical protein
MHNVRVMRNLMLNSASHPFCNQPAIGGPIYWIRNIVYHAPGGSTRTSNGAPGMVYFNNTILTETSARSTANSHWMNNLMLGENAAPAIFAVNSFTNYTSSDYNGFRVNPGAAYSFEWNSPVWNMAQDYRDLLAASDGVQVPPTKFLAQRRYATLAEFSADTHQDTHSVLLDYDVFVHVPPLDARDVKTVQKVYNADDLDFTLKPGSAAVDRGAIIPTVTDGYRGEAPDLGALESGQPAPHYGPRTR